MKVPLPYFPTLTSRSLGDIAVYWVFWEINASVSLHNPIKLIIASGLSTDKNFERRKNYIINLIIARVRTGTERR